MFRFARISAFLLIGILLGFSPAAEATSFLPILHNYGKKDYLGALQNWDITQGSNGEIYIGNGNGLLRYDGYTWTHTPLPSGGIVRSVMADGDRIYAGSYLDFGFFKADAYGNLKYTSLWPKKFESHDDEIWNIVKDRNGIIYFQSFSSWFSYDGKHVTPHYDFKMQPLYFFEVDGVIYTQIQNGDFYRLDGNKFTLLFKRAQVGSHIVSALSGGRGRLILCSQWNGLFRYDSKGLTRFSTMADAVLMKCNINRATLIPQDSTIVIGSILDGVYGIARNGALKWHYNMSNRLTNNSILDVKCDHMGNVWVALDAGVALINTSSPFSLLAPDNNSPTLGMVYGVYATGGNYYIATNQATWFFSGLTGQYQMVTGSEGQNWFVSPFGNQLIIGNNEGAHMVNGTIATPITTTNQSSTAMHICNIAGQRILLETSYYGVQIYKEFAGKWVFSHAINGFHAPVSQFEVDHQGNIWAAHMSHGLFKINLSGDLKNATFKRYEFLDGDTVLDRLHVMKIRGRVVFSYNKKLFTYDDLKDSIVRFTDLDYLGSIDILSATPVDENTLWIATEMGYSLVKWNGKKYSTLRNVTPAIFGLDANDNSSVVYVDGNMAYFGLNNGIGRLDMTKTDETDHVKHQLLVLRATTTGTQGETRNLPIDGGGSSETNITVTLSYPHYDFEPLIFSYHLEGGGNKVDNVGIDPTITYNALGYGSYHLTATVKTIDGTVLDTVEYKFSHPHPWYLSWIAWFVYVAIIIAIIYFYARWRTQKTAREMQHQYEDKKLQQDLKVLEQEKIIAEQKHQLLEAQLNDKTKEVASMALDAMARNQAIESIRTTLREKRRKGSISQADMQAMLSQLGANADSDNFWELYQNNFNLIHKNFFKNLKEKYPSLTSSDLKFCALLRLNLSTKDIAKFTQLSVRGVEGARYRLRKKFNLTEGESLLDFLLRFQ